MTSIDPGFKPYHLLRLPRQVGTGADPAVGGCDAVRLQLLGQKQVGKAARPVVVSSDELGRRMQMDQDRRPARGTHPQSAAKLQKVGGRLELGSFDDVDSGFALDQRLRQRARLPGEALHRKRRLEEGTGRLRVHPRMRAQTRGRPIAERQTMNDEPTRTLLLAIGLRLPAISG